MNVINDAKRANCIIEENYDEAAGIDSNLNRLYFSTNEYLDYFHYFDFKDKNVLTVCSSGDQAFFCLLGGAKKVDTFDSNPGQYYIMELKRAAILGLDKDEYLKFFPLSGGDLKENYNVKYYDIFKDNLHDDSRYFWDQIYKKENPSIYLLQRFSYNLFYQSDYTRDYDILKDALKKDTISFTESDIYHVSDLVDDKYSLIVLSNIYDHLAYFYDCSEEEYLDLVTTKFMPLLDGDGSCIFHYQRRDMPNSFNEYETIKSGYDKGVKVLRKSMY